MKLTKTEINKRLLRLRNLERLYSEQKIQNEKLRSENKTLKLRIKELEDNDKQKDIQLTTLALQIEELQKMVFKKKSINNPTKSTTPQTPQMKDSYRRNIPQESAVTKEMHHPIDTCPDCNTELKQKTSRTWYEEDIVLPTSEQSFKSVTKYTVEKGYCSDCRQWKSLIPISSSTVTLGLNIRLYICYLSILIRLSYSQIQTVLITTYNIKVSEGEIAKILKKEAANFRSTYEDLKKNIRNQTGVHYDETPWLVQAIAQGNYAWTMTGTDNNDVVFHCGRSRGKGNAEELKGDSVAIGISDDYGAYRNLFEVHQLCWAHPYRKLRDLAESTTLDDTTRDHCESVYKTFGVLYAETQAVVDTPFDIKTRTAVHSALIAKLKVITIPNSQDPQKLLNIKASLLRNTEKYFTCILHDGIPLDNNKAERSLRHLVIKRKTSFGSRSQTGAEVTSVLMSVLLSLWNRRPSDYFGELVGLRGV